MQDPRDALPYCLLACLLLTVLQPLRAAGRVLTAVAGERETRTLETLALTRLTPRELVDGWAQMGWVPTCVDAVWGGLVVAAMTLCCGEAAQSRHPSPDGLVNGILLLSLLSPVGCVLGAYLGVLASAVTRTVERAHAVMLFLGVLMAAVLGLVTSVAGPVAAAAAAAGLAVGLRETALERLRQ